MICMVAFSVVPVTWVVFSPRNRPPQKENSTQSTLYEQLSESLIEGVTLNSSRGKLLNIKHTETTSDNIITLNLTLDITGVTFPSIVQTRPYSSTNSNDSSKKYVYVIGRYWEQMSQNMRAFLALVLQAGSVGRSTVSSMVKDSRFQTNGFPLSYYFDREHIRSILLSYGYPDLVDKEEFLRECNPKDPNYTTVHFLYDKEKAATYTKNLFKLDDSTYSNVSIKARRNGWTKCSFIQKLTKQTPQSKMFCVDTTVVTDWKVFERDVIKSPKCLSIVLWRGIGQAFRARFRETGLKFYSRDFFITLKPSPAVMTEVEKFQRKFLNSKYIGVQIRGEHVAIQHGLARLKQCIHLLGYVLRRIKSFFGTSKVFVATDMSKFGSLSWKDSVKRDVITDETLPKLQELVLSVTNGVTFEQTAENGEPLDRGLVALIEITLVSRAQRLITLGFSTFQEWTVSKFLDFNRHMSPAKWSLVRLCYDDTT